MSLTRDQVLHIAHLARVGLTDEDVARFQSQLSQILEHFDVLRRVDTEDVPPTAHTLPLQNVQSEDVARPSLPLDAVLANAPEAENGMFRVRAVLE